ncbi:hypothetical protein AB0C98_38100 [Streptomyces sp. NPDC048558]|uniref:hypothetical protein n=1 Tax=Streptomyces sp. NPDC048558 TaxID=3155759 RepID=UPI00341BCB31
MAKYPDIAPLLDSWLLHLAAERKSAQTLKTYGDGVRTFLRWCETADRAPVLDRPTVNAFVRSSITRWSLSWMMTSSEH